MGQQIVALNKIVKVILLRSDRRLEEGKEIIQVEMWKESEDPKARAQPGGQCDWSREREGKQKKPGWGRKGERSQRELQPLQGSQLFL